MTTEHTAPETTAAFTVQSFGQQASGQPNSVTVSAQFGTLAEAEAVAGRFPKAVNAKVYRLTDGTASVGVSVDLRPKAGNEVNETGVKRLAKALEVARQLGTVTEAQW